MAIKNEIIDELLKGQDPKQVFSSTRLMAELKKALADRILNAERDQHLTESKQEEVRDERARRIAAARAHCRMTNPQRFNQAA